jgi:hypothetical protein
MNPIRPTAPTDRSSSATPNAPRRPWTRRVRTVLSFALGLGITLGVAACSSKPEEKSPEKAPSLSMGTKPMTTDEDCYDVLINGDCGCGPYSCCGSGKYDAQRQTCDVWACGGGCGGSNECALAGEPCSSADQCCGGYCSAFGWCAY